MVGEEEEEEEEGVLPGLWVQPVQQVAQVVAEVTTGRHLLCKHLQNKSAISVEAASPFQRGGS